MCESEEAVGDDRPAGGRAGRRVARRIATPCLRYFDLVPEMRDAYKHRLRLVKSVKERGIKPTARLFSALTVRKWWRRHCISAQTQNNKPLRTSRAVYWMAGKPNCRACGQQWGISSRSLLSALICWNKAWRGWTTLPASRPIPQSSPALGDENS